MYGGVYISLHPFTLINSSFGIATFVVHCAEKSRSQYFVGVLQNKAGLGFFVSKIGWGFMCLCDNGGGGGGGGIEHRTCKGGGIVEWQLRLFCNTMCIMLVAYNQSPSCLLASNCMYPCRTD